jgi:hypothetical protein
MNPPKMYSVEEAIKAQKSLRQAAGLETEEFPIQAFVGMISDEIESLRRRGKSDSIDHSKKQRHGDHRLRDRGELCLA